MDLFCRLPLGHCTFLDPILDVIGLFRTFPIPNIPESNVNPCKLPVSMNNFEGHIGFELTMNYSVSETGILGTERNSECSLKALRIKASPHALPLSCRRLVVAIKAIKLGSWDKHPADCLDLKFLSCFVKVRILPFDME